MSEGKGLKAAALPADLHFESKVGLRDRLRRKVGRRVGILILLMFAVLIFLPFWWMLVTSFKPANLVFEYPPEFIPFNPTLNNYERTLGYQGGVVGTWMLNSIIVAAVVTFGNLMVASWAGYALAKMDFPGRRTLFVALIVTMMIPGHVTLIPLYSLVLRMGWIDTYAALTIPWIGQVFGIFLMKQFMQTLPSSLIDAARIDACSEWRIFWKIILPLAMPGIAVLGIFIFMANWNSFIWPLVIMESREMTTIQVGLTLIRYQNVGFLDYSLLMATAVVAAVPMVIVFVLFQRYFLTGLRLGALKG
jgi:multiple sugar transport system permease protein